MSTRRVRTPIRSVRRASPPVATPRRSTMSTVRLDSVYSDVVSILTNAFSNFYYLALVLVVAYLIFTSGPNHRSGIVGSTLNGTSNVFVDFVFNSPNDATGLAILWTNIPLLPSSILLPYALATFAWVKIIPEAMIYEYMLQALFFLIYVKTNVKSTKMLLSLFAIAAYFLGWFIIGNNVTPLSSYSSTYTNGSLFQYR